MFRGSEFMLTCYNEVAVVMCAYGIREAFLAGNPQFEVCGPWRHTFL